MKTRKQKPNLSVQRKYWIALIVLFWGVPKQNPKITAKHERLVDLAMPDLIPYSFPLIKKKKEKQNQRAKNNSLPLYFQCFSHRFLHSLTNPFCSCGFNTYPRAHWKSARQSNLSYSSAMKGCCTLSHKLPVSFV